MTTPKKRPERDKPTGRFKHAWGWIYYSRETGREVAACQDCPMIHAYGGGRPDRHYRDLEAARGPEQIPSEIQ